MKKSFFDSWTFLMNHKAFNVVSIVKRSELAKELIGPGDELIKIRHSYFERCLDFMVVRFDPLTKEINMDNDSLNTKVSIWIEISMPLIDVDGDWGKAGELIMARDVNLNCSGDTFELAIINLANLIELKFGDDVTSAIITLNN